MKKSELTAFIKEEIVSALTVEVTEDKQTQQDIKDTEELTKAIDDLAKAKEEAGLAEEEDAPAGDAEIEKKASKQDIIIKNYDRLRKELKSHLKDYQSAKDEAEKQKHLNQMKKISQSAEYLDAKAKYEKLKQVK